MPASAPSTPTGRARLTTLDKGDEKGLDIFWAALRFEACGCSDPLIRDLYGVNICDHKDFPSALASLLATKLADRALSVVALKGLLTHLLADHPEITLAAACDILATRERDPACPDLATPFLFFKGWQATQAHRVGHQLWLQGRRPLAYHFQSRVNEIFAIDIHPAAQLGYGLTIDHGSGIVIGETSVVEDEVSLFQNVTLGGTGKTDGVRHPTLRHGCLVGAGAIVLGDIEIGAHARIGAASVVLENVPAYATIVGNPGRIVRRPTSSDASATSHSATKKPSSAPD